MSGKNAVDFSFAMRDGERITHIRIQSHGPVEGYAPSNWHVSVSGNDDHSMTELITTDMTDLPPNGLALLALVIAEIPEASLTRNLDRAPTRKPVARNEVEAARRRLALIGTKRVRAKLVNVGDLMVYRDKTLKVLDSQLRLGDENIYMITLEDIPEPIALYKDTKVPVIRGVE